MSNLTINNVTNCTENLRTLRTDCGKYTFENTSDYNIDITIDEIGGDYNVTFTIEVGETYNYTLPNDGMFEIGFSVLELEENNPILYDYLFEMCSFIKCYENLMSSLLCNMKIDPCEIILNDCADNQAKINESQRVEQLYNIGFLYQTYILRVFNFKMYWLGITSNRVATTEELAQLSFIIKRINKFIATCNLECEQQCIEC